VSPDCEEEGGAGGEWGAQDSGQDSRDGGREPSQTGGVFVIWDYRSGTRVLLLKAGWQSG